jgi:non-homologous end joining protein Ku
MISKPFNPAEALFALQENNMNKLIEMRDHDFEQHEYAQYYTDLLASLIEAKSKLTTAKSSFALVQSEVKRLLWNARVAEQPKLLDSDTRYHNSRGRDLRMQASRIEADAKTLIDDAEEDERNAKSDLVDLLKRWSGAESKTGLPPQD